MVNFFRRLAVLFTFACILYPAVSAMADTASTASGVTVPRAIFTNAEPTTPDLYIKKTVESSDSRYPADEDTEFTFILKLDGELAKNVQYTVIGEDGQEVEKTESGTVVPYKTDSNGKFTLKAGQSAKFTYVGEGVSYEVSEGTMPDGFTQVSPAGEAVGTVEEDGSFVEFTNRYTPSVTPSPTIETEPDGETEQQTTALRIEKKISFPDGYAYDTEAEFGFTVTIDGSLLADTSYKILDADTSEVTGSGTTDENGHFTIHAGEVAKFTVPAEGDYKVTEDNSGEWTAYGGSTKKGAVSYPVTDVLFTNIQAAFAVSKDTDVDTDDTFTFLLLDSDDKAIARQSYYLYNKDGERADTETYQTDGSGKFTLGSGQTAMFIQMDIGTAYQVREEQKEGWKQVLPASSDGYTDKTVSASVEVLPFVNNESVPETGTLTVYKNVESASSQMPDSSTEFSFLLTRLSEGKYIPVTDAAYSISSGKNTYTYKTDAEGRFTLKGNQSAIFEGLGLDSTYRVEEEQTDLRYTIDDTEKIQEAVLSDTLSFTFTNVYDPTAFLTLTKVDASDPTKMIEGVVFGIYSAETCADTEKVAEITTDADGIATSEELDLGTYYVKELSAPDGYRVSDTVYPVTLDTAKETVAVTDGPITNEAYGKITLTKVDSAIQTKTLVGAVFGIYSADTCADAEKVAEITTGDDGTATSEELAMGTYYVKELTAPENYAVSDTVYPVTLSEAGETVQVADGLVTDVYTAGSIKLVKYDSDGTTPLAGVTFSMKDGDGKTTELTTDSNGEALFDSLEPGTYEITETKTVAGHSLLAEPITVTLPLQMTDAEVEAQGNIDTAKAVHDETSGIYYFYNLTYHVTNSVSLDMPASGSGGFPWQTAVAGLLVICAAAAFRERKRRA